MVRRTETGNRAGQHQNGGFTLIELLVVMAIIGGLMSIVAPSFLKQNDRAKETVLRHNLKAMRQSIDDYRADHGKNPESLTMLVSARYLRELPIDPITGKSDAWVVEEDDETGIREVRSAARGQALDGSDYADW